MKTRHATTSLAVIEDYFLYGGGYIYPEMYGNEFVSLRYIRYGAISSFLYGQDPVFKVGEYVLSNGMSLRDDEVIKLLRDTKDGLKGESIITAHQQILSTMYREIVYEKLLISSGGNKIGRLNEAISLLLSLQDSYYTEYIWNASSLHNEQLKKAGLDDDFFGDVEDKLRTLRSILMGDSLDFDKLYRRLYDEALGHEVYWREFYENRNKELERKLNRIETEKKT